VAAFYTAIDVAVRGRASVNGLLLRVNRPA
jgi:hypothetical protein